jgi:hypothetical protein
MGSATVFEMLPDMPDDPGRPAVIFEERGTQLVEKVEPVPQSSPEEAVLATTPPIGYQASQDQYEKKHDRPEDQPMPTPNDRKVAHQILIEMVQGRLDLGISRYGTGLQPFNGRNSTVDALEELVDLAVYLVVHNDEKQELGFLLDELRPMVGMSSRGNEIIDRLAAYFSGHSA